MKRNFFAACLLIFFNTQVFADDLGIDYSHTTQDGIIIFNGCSEENIGDRISINSRGDKGWKPILDKSGEVSTDELETNWQEYINFFKNCEEIKINGTTREVDYEKCQKNPYFIPDPITAWREYCNLDDANAGDDNSGKSTQVSQPEQQKKNDNKFKDLNVSDSISQFKQSFDVIFNFLDGDYKRLKARAEDQDEKFSDEDLSQKRDVIEDKIKKFNTEFINALHLIDRLNTLLCTDENICEDRRKVYTLKNGDGQIVIYHSYKDPIMVAEDGQQGMMVQHVERENKFISKVTDIREAYVNGDILLEQEYENAMLNINQENKRQKAQQEQEAKEEREKAEKERREKEEKERLEAEEREKEEKRKKKEQEKNNKIRKQFSEIIDSIEKLENDDYVNLLDKIEELSNLKFGKDYQLAIIQINNQLEQEKEIKKEISTLLKNYKKLINNLESQKFFKLDLITIEQLEERKTVIKNIEELNNLLEQQIINLEKKKVEINKRADSDKTWGTIYKILYYILLFIIIGFVGFFSYRSGKSSSNESNDSVNSEKLRELNLKIKLLQEQNNNLEKIISKNLENNKSRTSDYSAQDAPKISEPTEEEIQQQKDKERSMAYDDALENPNLISKFVDMYGVIGLDKAVKVAKGQNALLKRDDKSIERCNFWGMPNPNPKNISGDQWIIFPGRTLQSNAAALTADDSRYGRELLSGIFNFEVGSTFRVVSLAIAIKEQDGFRVVSQGNLVIPK